MSGTFSDELKPLILVVDDEERNVALLEAHLGGHGYRTLSARDGAHAVEVALRDAPDLILLDVMMPGMSGVEVVAMLKSNARTKAIPVVMVTALHDRSTKLLALNSGAEEFIEKPVDTAELLIRVRNLVRLKQLQDQLANQNLLLEGRVEERTRQLTASYRETIYTLARAAEHKDEETGAHVRRISYYTAELSRSLGLDSVFCDQIFHASPMHDVGKIGIPDAVLLKPGKLDADEWTLMKTHAQIGAMVLAGGESPYIKMGADIALRHHERWDGSGYPDGLRGDETPLAARIMSICDVYDALRSKRPYKPAFEHAQAMDIITRGDGRTQPEHFDPAVLEAFRAEGGRLAEIYAEHVD